MMFPKMNAYFAKHLSCVTGKLKDRYPVTDDTSICCSISNIIQLRYVYPSHVTDNRSLVSHRLLDKHRGNWHFRFIWVTLIRSFPNFGFLKIKPSWMFETNFLHPLFQNFGTAEGEITEFVLLVSELSIEYGKNVITYNRKWNILSFWQMFPSSIKSVSLANLRKSLIIDDHVRFNK